MPNSSSRFATARTSPPLLRSLAPGVLHRIEVPSDVTVDVRRAFILHPVREAIASGLPVLYVDWSRRSQRWGDVLAAVGGDLLLGTLSRREQALDGRFELDRLDEPLGGKVTRAAARLREAHGVGVIVLDATQPGPNSCSPEMTDRSVTLVHPAAFTSGLDEPVVIVYPATRETVAVEPRLTSGLERARERWGVSNIWTG